MGVERHAPAGAQAGNPPSRHAPCRVRRPGARRRGHGYPRAAACRPDRSAGPRQGPVEGLRPGEVRLRREPLPVRAAGRRTSRDHRGRGRGAGVRARPRPPGRLPRRRHQPQRPGPGRGHPGRRATALHRHRGPGRRRAGPHPARHHGGAGQRDPRPVRQDPRARPGQRHRLHRRRGGRQQRLRHDRGHHPQLVPHPRLTDLRAARRHRRRHGRPARGRVPGADRAGAVRGAAGAQGGDRGGSGAHRPHPGQVRDQEHQRLPAGRLPGRRHARRDPAWSHGRLRGHLRLHLRRRLRHPAAGPQGLQRPALLPLADRRRGGRPPVQRGPSPSS